MICFFAATDVVKPMNDIMTAKYGIDTNYDIPSFARHLEESCSEKRGRILERRGEKEKKI